MQGDPWSGNGNGQDSATMRSAAPRTPPSGTRQSPQQNFETAYLTVCEDAIS